MMSNYNVPIVVFIAKVGTEAKEMSINEKNRMNSVLFHESSYMFLLFMSVHYPPRWMHNTHHEITEMHRPPMDFLL